MKYLVTILSLASAFALVFIIKGTSQTYAERTPFGDSLDYYVDKFQDVIDPYEKGEGENAYEFDNVDSEGLMVALPSHVRSRYESSSEIMNTVDKVDQVDSIVKAARKCLAEKDICAFHDLIVANWKHFIFHPANNLDNEQALFDAVLLISKRCYPAEQASKEGIELYEWYLTHLKLTEVYTHGKINSMPEINPLRPMATFYLMQYYNMSNQTAQSISIGEELLRDIRNARPDDIDLLFECANELAHYYNLTHQPEKIKALIEKYNIPDFT